MWQKFEEYLLHKTMKNWKTLKVLLAQILVKAFVRPAKNEHDCQDRRDKNNLLKTILSEKLPESELLLLFYR